MITREQIQAELQVDGHGIIRSPGKFEGEPVWVRWAYEVEMNGFAELTKYDGIQAVEVEAADVKEFPELEGCAFVLTEESEQGFYTGKAITAAEAAEYDL